MQINPLYGCGGQLRLAVYFQYCNNETPSTILVACVELGTSQSSSMQLFLLTKSSRVTFHICVCISKRSMSKKKTVSAKSSTADTASLPLHQGNRGFLHPQLLFSPATAADFCYTTNSGAIVAASFIDGQ